MTTIGVADTYGLPVSITQILSSGVAGAMAVNKSGLQRGRTKFGHGLAVNASCLVVSFRFPVLVVYETILKQIPGNPDVRR